MGHEASLLARRDRGAGALGALGKTATDIVHHIAREGGTVKREEAVTAFG